MKPLSFRLIGAAALVLVLPLTSWSASRLVPDTYATVQDAVNAAAGSGDEVHITTAGSYVGFAINTKNLPVIGDVGGITITSTINIDGAASVTLQRLTVDTAAVGISTNSAGSTTTIDNCLVTANTNQGVSVNQVNDVIVRNSQIVQNSSFGIVINGTGANGCTITVSDSQVTTNTGNGFAAYGSGTLVCTNVDFSGNGSNGNLGIFQPVAGTFTNCKMNSGVRGILQDGDAARGTTVNLSACEVKGNSQQGILLARTASATLANTVISGNGATGFERNYDTSGSPNAATTISFDGCTVTGNSGYGVIVQMNQANVTANFAMNNTRVAGNTNIQVFANSNPGVINATFDRCTFVDGTNNAAYNMYLRASGANFVRNCLFDEGYAGIRVEGGTSKIYHCTLVSRSGVANRALDVVWAPASNHELKNSIIDGHQNGLVGSNGTNIINSNNCIRTTVANFSGDCTNGTNNLLGVDPKFVTATTGVGTGNFHLQTSSPCIGTRSNAPDLGLTTDLDGSLRANPGGTPPDLGAYEDVTAPVSVSALTIE